MTWGVTAAGFVAKPREQVQSEIDSGLKKGLLGDSAGTEPDGSIPLKSKAGQLKTLLTDFGSSFWDLLQAIYTAWDPSKNTDAAQDAVGSITGTVREGALFSTATVTCTGDPGTVLLLGRVAVVPSTRARFDSMAQKSIIAATAWLNTHVYVLGDRVTNAARIYQCITTGTSAGSGGPTTTASDITDGTVHWKYVGEGTGVVDVPVEAETAGPVGSLAGSMTQIATPVSGWKSVINLTDALVGRLKETNAQFRARRDEELASRGNTTPEAITANILAVNQGSTDPLHQPVVRCKVFYNDTDYVDGNGLAPHSVEILARGGTDQDIADEVWRSVGGGTATVGNQLSTVTDSQGNPQVVRWSRPDPVDIWVVLTVFYDPTKWPSSGAAALVQQAALSAILTDSLSYDIGEDVRALPVGSAVKWAPSQLDDAGSAVVPAVAGSVPAPGIVDVDPIYIGTAPAPGTSTAITVGPRQFASFDSSHIAVTATPEAP